MNLEATIRLAASAGHLKHLTLFPRGDGSFQANYLDRAGNGYRCTQDRDPVGALLFALRDVERRHGETSAGRLLDDLVG